MKLTQMQFPGGKKKAFTISYDDGVCQDRRLLDLMGRYGIKGTFNLNYGLLGRRETAVIEGHETDISTFLKEEVCEVYKDQEIACHGITHWKLTDISEGTACWQVLEDRRKLETLTGKLVQGFAYPFGVYNKKVTKVLKSCGIHYARTVERTGEFKIPQNFLTWNPTCHHNDPDLMALLETFCRQNALFGEPALFYLWGHAYEFDQKQNWETIEKAFQYLQDYKEEIWMASNGEIYDYVKAFQKLEFTVDGSKVWNPGYADVWVGDEERTFRIPGGRLVTLE